MTKKSVIDPASKGKRLLEHWRASQDPFPFSGESPRSQGKRIGTVPDLMSFCWRYSARESWIKVKSLMVLTVQNDAVPIDFV